MDIQTVYPKVKIIIADVLAVDTDEIDLDKTLIGDLNAESIDFLDLVFRLEREFNIKIPRGQIEKDARGSLSDAEFERDGIITEAGIATLKKYLSEVPENKFKAKMKVSEIPGLFTVATICKLVANAQAKAANTAPEAINT